MQINRSIDDYLERILMLQKARGEARSVDVATELGVTKASVSHAMKLLRENGYIIMDREQGILLTDKGLEIAQRMMERHEMLSRILINLGVPEEIAVEDACRMEHDMSQETFDALCRLKAARQEP